MDGPTFDTLVQRLADRAARRGVLAGLAGAGLAGAAGLTRDDVAGKRNKKVTLCHGGQTITASAKRKKKLLKAGATPGACPTRTSTTTPAVCPDLQPGADLQAAIDAALPGETLRLCPGRFRVTNTLSVTRELTIIGAGFEETILDGEDARRVISTSTPMFGVLALTLENLTITGGKVTDGSFGGGIAADGTLTLRSVIVSNCTAASGGGVANSGGTLILEDTAITDCTATDPETGGGGIVSNGGTVILKALSTVRRNRGGRCGGGIRMLPGSEANVLTLQATSVVFENEADTGGGICVFFGAVTVEAGGSVGSNTARGGDVGDFGGGIRHFSSIVTVAAGTVGANSPDNCFPATDNCV